MSFRYFFLTLAIVVSLVFAGLQFRGRGTGRGHASVASAVARRQFPLFALGSHFSGQALDPLENPGLVQALFPGYPPALQSDKALWAGYFSREFEIKVTSSWLSENSLYGAVVLVSWTGCLDVVKKYGADIVLIGASDLAQGLPADELAKSYRGQRVLVCASPSLTPDAVTDFLASLREAAGERKPKLLVVALNTTLSYASSIYYPSIDHAKRALLLSYRQREFLRGLSYLDHPVTSPVSWNDLLPVRRSVSHLPLPARLERQGGDAPADRWSVLTTAFPKSVLSNPDELARLRRDFQPVPYFFRDMRDPSCARLSRLPQMLSELRAAASASADHVLLTLTPTTGDELLEAPGCYLPLLKSSLESLANEQTWVVTKDAAALGLDIPDFVFADKPTQPDLLRLDLAHLNIQGGRKYAAFIARELLAHGYTGGDAK